MPVFSLDNKIPSVDATASVAASASVIGSVTLQGGSIVLDRAVLRGDNEPILIGTGSVIGEGVVIHCDPGFPMTLGANVVVERLAMMHGCTIGDGTRVGIQAVVMNGAVIGKNCVVTAGALVTEGKIFPDGSIITGAPAKVYIDTTGHQDLFAAEQERVEASFAHGLRVKEILGHGPD